MNWNRGKRKLWIEKYYCMLGLGGFKQWIGVETTTLYALSTHVTHFVRTLYALCALCVARTLYALLTHFAHCTQVYALCALFALTWRALYRHIFYALFTHFLRTFYMARTVYALFTHFAHFTQFTRFLRTFYALFAHFLRTLRNLTSLRTLRTLRPIRSTLCAITYIVPFFITSYVELC